MMATAASRGWRKYRVLGSKWSASAKTEGKKLSSRRGNGKSEARTSKRQAKQSAIESLVFTLKEGFEFGQMARRTHQKIHSANTWKKC